MLPKTTTITTKTITPSKTPTKNLNKSSNKKSSIKKTLDVFYDMNGVLHYIGETLDGRASGKGKLYHENGVLEYEGAFKKNL